MPRSLISLPVFSVSDWIAARRSSGPPETMTPPRSAMGLAKPGSLAIFCRLALRRPATSAGKPAGARIAHQVTSTKPGTAEATVGTSGSTADGCAPVTASARTLPPLISGKALGRLSNIICTCPATRSCSAGAEPL